MRFIFIGLMFITTALLGNPFLINFDSKENITNEDYLNVQRQLTNLKNRKFLDQLLRPEDSIFMKNYHYARCTVGVRQTMINPEKGLFPFRDLVKIGKGGNRCIVSFASYDKNYHIMLRATPAALEKTGFNGYFLYRIGGYPNPTGIELQFAGVPYAFKIFMMVEAQKLGFNSVLWIDSSALPLKNPDPLFEHLEKKGSLNSGWGIDRQGKHDDYFAIARESLRHETGVDIYEAPYMATGVFGLDLSKTQAQEFVADYYHLVQTGLGFLSEWPETNVLMALFTAQKNENWRITPYPFLMIGPEDDESDAKMEEYKNKGFYFYIRKHN